MIEVGVTATRRGLTAHQTSNIWRWLLVDKTIRRLHHGMCVGGDEQIHDIAKDIGLSTFGHPPINTKYLADCDVDEEAEPAEYLERDRHIVDAAAKSGGYLIVAPFQDQEPASRRGSGTWYAYNYAKDTHKLMSVIFWPTLPYQVRIPQED